MKIIFVTVYRVSGDERKPVRLALSKDLSAFRFFTRGTIEEHCQFASRMVAQRTPLGRRQTVDQKDGENPFMLHVHVRQDGLAVVVMADKDYPMRTAFTFINKVMLEFEKANGDAWKKVAEDKDDSPEFLVKEHAHFQDPATADKLTAIQKNLDDIKDVMHKNIEEVLKRGETLESLMEKSDDLSVTSVKFYKTAKKQNQCCQAY